MHYFVDGYNLLFKMLSKKKSLEANRSAIIYTINEISLNLHLQITLVFDATFQKERLGMVRTHYDALEIIYTADKDADSYILEEIEYAKSPSQITVVTSDRELAHKANQLGAHSQSISQFIAWLNHKKAKQKSRLSKPLAFKDSNSQIERLLKIFEEKLKNE